MTSPDPLLRAQFSPLVSFHAQISPEHQSERFHVLQSGDTFYLRLDKHSDWLGIFASDEALAGMAHGHGERVLRREEWQMRVVERRWGRVLSLSDPDGGDELWRVLWKGKRSFLMRGETGEVVDFRSGDEWKKGAWIQPGAYFLKKFGREWKNPNSDVRTALCFLETDDETRRLWGLEWVRGSWAEMKSVLRAAAIIEHEFGERSIVQSRPIYTMGQRQIGFGSNAPQSGRLIRLLEKLELQHVAALRDKSKLRRLALRPFDFEFGIAKWPELRVVVDPPSEHEKLEARLELRQWLRAEAPDLARDW